MSDDGWIRFDEPIPLGPIYDDNCDEQDSFRKRDLMKPGTVLRVLPTDKSKLKAEEVVIGHINRMGGTCDDCGYDRDTLIIGYKVVWSES